MNKIDPFKDKYWIPRGTKKILTYFGPHLKHNLNPREVISFSRKKGAWGLIWSYDQDYTDQSPWYHVVCDTPDYEVSVIKSKNARHNIRRSLKRCQFRQLDYLWLAENGYDVYVQAASRYKNFQMESKSEFYQNIIRHADNPDSEAFGVFVEDKLIAYITLFITEKNVRGDVARFDPNYSNCYPMFALYYSVANHYLKDGNYNEVDCGTKPLLHETNIGDFLKQVGFRKTYCRFGVYWSPTARLGLSLLRILKNAFKLILPARHYSILEGLLLTQDLVNETNPK